MGFPRWIKLYMKGGESMRLRKLLASFLVCTLILGCSTIFAGAAEVSSIPVISARITTSLNHEISANTIVPINDWFYMNAGDTITYNCTYTPKSANVDFGCIDADGVFYYLNCTNGSINKSIEASQRGQYMLAIRNNSSRTIIVTGSVKY